MKRRTLIASAAVTASLLVAGAQAASASSAGESAKAAPEASTTRAAICKTDRRPGESGEEIAAAKLLIEYNSTDADIGVHGAFDDDGWTELCVLDPSGRPVLLVGPQGQLADLSMAGIFFESREPPEGEFSFDDLMAAFPEGKYQVRGKAHDGTILTGSATFTHDAPAAPEITSPELAEDEDGTAETLVPSHDLVVTWDPVTETILGDDVAITGYQVIITSLVEDDPNGFSRPAYDVHVPGTATSLSVPDDFLQPGSVYELEVLALESSGNQTISVGFFATE